MQRNHSAALFLSGTVRQFQNRANVAGRVSDHPPREASNLARSQAGFGRQKDNDLVPQWVSAGFGEQQEIFGIVIR
jgi:hypothetical protein